MNPQSLKDILDLINKAILIGGELLPIALRAYAAIRAETGMTDDELSAASEQLNKADDKKLKDLLNSLPDVSE